MPTNFYKSSYKIVILSLLISAFIISNVYFVSVYDIYSSYDLFWVWATKSIANDCHFFYVGFLLNLMVVSSIIFAILLGSKALKNRLLKRYWLIFGILSFGIIWSNLDFILILNTHAEPLFTPEIQNKFYSIDGLPNQMYCHYFTVGRDNYLASGGCDVPN